MTRWSRVLCCFAMAGLGSGLGGGCAVDRTGLNIGAADASRADVLLVDGNVDAPDPIDASRDAFMPDAPFDAPFDAPPDAGTAPPMPCL